MKLDMIRTPRTGAPSPAIIGRPRNPETQNHILSAAANILVEEGFRSLTMEKVSVRAGVGKTTVYRRWKSVDDLVSDLLEQANQAWPMPQTDFKDITDALSQLYRNWICGMSGPGRIIPVLIAEGIQNPDLADLLHKRFVLPRRRLAIAIIEKAKMNGDVSSRVDSETAIDLFMGRMWYRQLVTGGSNTIEDEQKVISLLVKGLNNGE
jgi:AcrR family transcriptional regulator